MDSVKNPIATIKMQNGAVIVVELMTHIAPNTVNSFIHLARQGAFDHYRIARIEPGFVVDASTNAFGRAACRYLIANEAPLVPAEKRMEATLGTLCMGGYPNGIAGGEFFFPLAHHPRLDGHYPCFGRVIEGVEEIERLGTVPVEAFKYIHSKPMHKPQEPQVIERVTVETFGECYPGPQRLEDAQLPPHWLMEDYEQRV